MAETKKPNKQKGFLRQRYNIGSAARILATNDTASVDSIQTRESAVTDSQMLKPIAKSLYSIEKDINQQKRSDLKAEFVCDSGTQKKISTNPLKINDQPSPKEKENKSINFSTTPFKEIAPKSFDLTSTDRDFLLNWDPGEYKKIIKRKDKKGKNVLEERQTDYSNSSSNTNHNPVFVEPIPHSQTSSNSNSSPQHDTSPNRIHDTTIKCSKILPQFSTPSHEKDRHVTPYISKSEVTSTKELICKSEMKPQLSQRAIVSIKTPISSRNNKLSPSEVREPTTLNDLHSLNLEWKPSHFHQTNRVFSTKESRFHTISCDTCHSQTTEKDTEKSFTAGPIESSNPSLTPTQSISVPRLPDGSQSGFCFADATNIIHVNGVPYLRLDVIGRGGSSKVYKVLSRDYNIYALKRVRLNKKEGASLSNYANEITLLQKLRGKDHIIQLFDAEIDQKEKLLCMIMEHGEIDLSKVLERQKNTKQIDENFIRLTWQQMLQAVETIHEARIVHGDLKPANFLFVRGAVKLIDFGIAKAISNDTTNIVRDSQVGTINYMSPEAIIDSSQNVGVGSGDKPFMKLGRPSDVWSLGCILYQMIYGKTPFAHLSILQKLQRIVDPSYKIEFPDIPDGWALETLQGCLQRDPAKRMPIGGQGGLLSHPFLRPSQSRGTLSASQCQNCNLSDPNLVVVHRSQLESLIQNLVGDDAGQSEIQTLSSVAFGQMQTKKQIDLKPYLQNKKKRHREDNQGESHASQKPRLLLLDPLNSIETRKEKERNPEMKPFTVHSQPIAINDIHQSPIRSHEKGTRKALIPLNESVLQSRASTNHATSNKTTQESTVTQESNTGYSLSDLRDRLNSLKSATPKLCFTSGNQTNSMNDENRDPISQLGLKNFHSKTVTLKTVDELSEGSDISWSIHSMDSSLRI